MHESRELPTGTVTFVFTDIEGSTRLLHDLGRERYAELQDAHGAIVRRAVSEHGGIAIRTEGDAFFVVFASAVEAVGAAVAAQRGLAEHRWPDDAMLRIRIGMHTGEGTLGGDDYLSIDVNRAARIAATGHGGQVVLSHATRALVADDLPEGVALRDHGPHRLKDFDRPEPLHDLVIEGLVADFPELATLDRRDVRLPSPRTTFVGREREIEEVGALLDDASRLVTLTGPGGTGKTRLAIEVAAARVDAYETVAFVDLSTVDDASLVVPAIAGVLRVRETPGVDLGEALRAHLGQRRALLVLDNLEQIVDGAAILGDLLDAAPDLSVLATSRITLHLAGEREVAIAPLPLPDAGERDPALVAACAAVRLLVDRAGASGRALSVTDANAPVLAEIATRLDGLPLALELAASRLRVLDPASLAERLERRLPLLTGGPRDAPERHRTLTETIRWSEEALDDVARRLFALLAILPAGATLATAERVCGDDLDVLGGLEALVDASLVVRRDDDIELPEGERGPRFTMLETIREYALGRLDTAFAEERAALEARLTGWALDLADRAEPMLLTEYQRPWLDLLDVEHDNLRAAIDVAERADDDDAATETGMRTAAALWRFWQQRGHLAEGRARLDRLLALPGAAGRTAGRARALGAIGGIDYWRADYEPMAAAYEEALAIAEEVGDRHLLSHALYDRSFVGMVRGQPGEGDAFIERCLEVAEPDDLQLQALAWIGIGFDKVFTGDPAGAIEPVQRGIELHRRAGQLLPLCEGIVALGALSFLLGDDEAARTSFNEATELGRGSGNALIVAQVLQPHALLALRGDRPERAARLVGAWDRLRVEHDINYPQLGTSFFGDAGEITRAELGDADFERLHAEGSSLDLDAIVDLAADR